jgi:hypothetical protein
MFVCAGLAAGAAFAGAASAHHSFAMFDFSKEATLPGTVREFHWMNPHIHILLDAADDKGRVQTWDIEGPAPNALRPQGWSREALAAGEKVSVVVHPLKSGGLGGSLVRAYRADGALVGARPATPQPGPAG